MQIHSPRRYPDIDLATIRRALRAWGIAEAQLEIVPASRDGRYIYFDYNGVRHYICFANDPASSGRNSLLMQYLGTAYEAFVLDEHPSKQMAVFFPYAFLPGQTIARYHSFVNRLVLTLGLYLLNEAEAMPGQQSAAFTDFSDLERARSTQRAGTAPNRSSYLVQEEDRVVIYGKLYGANAKESLVLAAAARRITNLPVQYYPVIEQSTSSVPQKTAQVLAALNIHVKTPIALQLSSTEVSEIARSTARKTARFHFNLLEKFGSKKCYMCDCTIETAIIGAHIHRVTDIDASDLSYEAKVLQATDGDNGLWLCATHDKLFEYGTVYYDGSFTMALQKGLSADQIAYINELTTHQSFLTEHRGGDTGRYLQLHRQRVNG
jgi:hypothetical protein